MQMDDPNGLPASPEAVAQPRMNNTIPRSPMTLANNNNNNTISIKEAEMESADDEEEVKMCTYAYGMKK
jgi:hypothetical protein